MQSGCNGFTNQLAFTSIPSFSMTDTDKFYNPPLPPKWLLLGSPMLMDPHPSQLHAGLQHAALLAQHKVTRPKARFKPTSPEKSGLDEGEIRFQHILVSCFTCPHRSHSGGRGLKTYSSFAAPKCTLG